MKSTILFILHLPPPVHGAAMMGKYINESKLINDAFDCHYINLTTAKSLQDIGKGGIRKLWKFIKLLWNIFRDVKKLNPQVVYITPNACGNAFYKDFIVMQLLKSINCNVIAHYHNKGVITCQDKWLDDKLYKLFFKNIKIILLAESLYKDIAKYVERKNVFICPNGIPSSHSILQVNRCHPIPHLLFLSNLLISKGVISLLDAAKILKEKGCSFICEFVGGETSEIDSKRFNKEVQKRGLNNFVVYEGKKYGEEKRMAFENADIFVFPTYYPNECFPLVLLEAMEYALPCISTNEGGICDIIDDGKTGIILNTKDTTKLAEEIESLLLHKAKREEMGLNGYNKFKQEFTLEEFEKRMKHILEYTTKG